MQEKESKRISGVASGLLWTLGERFSAQLVSLVVSVILARILDPDHYGIVSIVMVFITLLNVFVTSGFGSALVQKKDANEIDFNSTFIFSLFLSILLYCVLFWAAPAIGDFYGMNELTLVTRVMGLRLPVSAFNSIQQAFIRRQMEFKRFFWATLGGTIISGVVGILLAFYGFGVWALVAQYLINVTIDTIVLFFVGGWKPKMQFSFSSVKSIWGFGCKVLATQLVATLEDDIRSLIVGKVFGSSDLAFYDHGKKYPGLLVTNINASIEKVMLPAYSRKQDDMNALLDSLRNSIRIGVYLLAPLLLGFSVVSGTFVKLLLGDKWMNCVPFIQVFCLSYLTRPLESSCHQALLAIGKSGIVFKCMLTVNVVAILGVIYAVFFLNSVFWIAVFNLITTIVSLIVFLTATKKHLGYSSTMQALDVLPSLLSSLAMAGVVFLLDNVATVLAIKLVMQVICGILVYLGLSIIFNLSPYVFLKDAIVSYVKRD